MTSPYLVGLRLRGLPVVVVGGGRVATRRVPKLLAAGAVVTVVSPSVSAELEALAADGGIDWVPRDYRPGDLAGAWYAIAATSSPTVNASAANEAEEHHIFCVRADHADGGTAWTPATGQHEGLVVGVVGSHDPLRSRRARDRLVEVIEDEAL